MKKKLLIFCAFMLLATSALMAQNVNIPDPVFKNFLVNHSYSTNPTGIGTTIYLDSNHDGEIQVTEAASYSSDVYNHAFYLNGLNISDLTGIEAFQSIETLNIDFLPLTSINLTGCVSLKTLRSNGNLFTTLTLNNPALEVLDCNSAPNLTDLNVSGCPSMKKITVQSNPILTSLNINGCGLLEEMRINLNDSLTDLTMGAHSELTLFQCYDNALTSLDVSSCTSLEFLFSTGNQLTSLNLANGNPQSFEQILATGYPDLTCIEVDNVTVSEFLWDGDYPYSFDPWAEFSTDCTPPGPCLVSIPDAIFKAYLVGNAEINTNGNADIECTEAEAYTGAIMVDTLDISDMTGIEAFVNLGALSCNNLNPWNFTSLNVSNLKELTTLSCTGNNNFSELDMTGCIALTNFSANTGSGGIQLTVNASGCTALTGFNVTSYGGLSLDLDGCSALTSLNLNNKNLNYLNLNNCTSLTTLSCTNNNLDALNLSGCTALTSIDCRNNAIEALNISHILGLETLNCSSNQLSNLYLLDNTNLTTLDCSTNNLPYLIVSNNTALTDLNCSYNNINYLDVSNTLNLINLNCSYNNLTTQNVSSNTALNTFNCSYNQLTTINVSANTNLQSLLCSGNDLPSIDVSQNAQLTSLTCSDNLLTTIDVTQNQLLSSLTCDNNQLTNINVSNNPNLFLLECSYNQLTTLDVSNTHCILLTCGNNQLESLNMANGYSNTAVIVRTTNNPSLECIQVDDADYSTANWIDPMFFEFDAGVSFSEDCATLGIDTPSSIAALTFYPNPTQSVVYFSKQVDVQLYNVSGQVISIHKDVRSIDVSNQPTGMYFMTLTDNEGQFVQQHKIMKD